MMFFITFNLLNIIVQSSEITRGVISFLDWILLSFCENKLIVHISYNYPQSIIYYIL